jgi:Flp pilus assembly protein TadG
MGVTISMGMLSRLRARTRSFFTATSGNLTVILAVSAIPLLLAVGAGVDYARALVAHSNMADALDAAGLAVGAAPNKPVSCPGSDATACATLQAVAQQFFNANFTPDSMNMGVPTVTLTLASEAVTLTTTYNVPTTFLAAADKMLSSSSLDQIAVTASSTVVWGQTKLWVSLVLDNTGSMCQPDSQPCSTDNNANIKINALQAASHSLLTTLQNASNNPGDVMVGLVPFAKDVNVGTANVGAGWIDWTDWSAKPSSSAVPVPSSSIGPGDSCPYSWNGNNLNSCLTQPGGVLTSTNTSGKNVTMIMTSTVPSTGTYAGYICPGSIYSSSSGQTGHYYNGCYTSTAITKNVGTGKNATCNGYSDCTCTGSNSSKSCTAITGYSHAWVTNAKSTWRGCVMDRNQNDDADDTTPGTLFPAENSDSCPYAAVLPIPNQTPFAASDMATMFTNLGTQVDAMLASGGTNQTIGLAHGMQLQSTGLPYNPPTLGTDTTRYIILLSDGLNTMDRWYGNGSDESPQVNTRMAAACTQAKSEGFVIYTIFVDLGGTQGNSSTLQSCASDPNTKYFDLTTSGAIITTFDSIAQQITSLRVSK